jgi:hypothetical protein
MKPFIIFILAAFSLLFLQYDTRAQSESELPEAGEEPWLAEEGDYAAQFNQAQKACYLGSMEACDSIWLSGKILMDTWLFKYGRTCGGRVDLREIRRASNSNGSSVTCAEWFPGH